MAGVVPQPIAEMPLGELPKSLTRIAGWVECIEALQRRQTATFDSVWGSACALLAAAVSQATGKPILVVHPDDKSVDQFSDDWPTFSQENVETFPSFEAPSDEARATDLDFGQRLRLLKALGHGHSPRAMAASVLSLMQPVPGPQQILAHCRLVRSGQRLDLEETRTWLVENAFEPTTAVQFPGEFSSRGGILDVFAPDWNHPVRIELFDDEVESIRQFDAGTQRSVQPLMQVELTGFHTTGGEPASLLEHLHADTVILLVELPEIIAHARLYGERGPANLIALDELQSAWSSFALASIHRVSAAMMEPSCRLPVDLVGEFSGDIGDVRSEVDRAAQAYELHLVATSDAEISRVQEILKTSRAAIEGRIHYTTGCVHQGFRLRHSSCIVVGCDQLFRRSDLRRSWRRRTGRPIDSFVDLKDGDLIVHLAHGIGRYRGLKLLDQEGKNREHLELEFDGGTRIYVPASKIDLVQKYLGGTKRRPRLAKIGGKTWLRQKRAAQAAVTDLAAEMLEVQARRAAQPGIAMGADTQWQFEFEHSFPYRETRDQLAAIEAIKADMQRPRPMDRLLCGDVGFGKTEIAMRATFKAVENGYQVALLVPTTVLAEQHFRVFSERMAEFPVAIEKLSRFCSALQQKQTVEGLKAGRVDVVIGTHRLASKDIRFRNLGLVIIDEEQRFGVTVKERLKSLRSEVDVLTMSATPIPRTLHMSLVGVRDISNLETPPEDRLAVETRVARFDRELIEQAVLRELNRGGQIYFVHNRIHDIHLLEQKIKSIVPDARIAVGHGQMPEDRLEQTMTQFVNGDFDLLLATTIVENGLDIPNANTMIIDQADRYGLSDLHQLRGRVGRYKNKAYCYLLLDTHKPISPNAAKRLQAIEQFSEIGAGFAIAMRDLEIRGAGNLLGTEQSGHIATVGYELYCQLLEAAVRGLKQLPPKLSLDVDIELPVDAYLPDEYVPDRRQKIEIYRRLSRIESFDELQRIRDELADRFGPTPKPVGRLLELVETRLEAAIWQIEAIFIEGRYLGFRFRGGGRRKQLITQCRYPLRPVDQDLAYLTLKSCEIPADRLLQLVKSILQVPAAKP